MSDLERGVLKNETNRRSEERSSCSCGSRRVLETQSGPLTLELELLIGKRRVRSAPAAVTFQLLL